MADTTLAPLTREQTLARGVDDTCPICKLQGTYDLDRSQDGVKFQDAMCANGHAWREIWTSTHLVLLDPETAEEIGAPEPTVPGLDSIA